MLEMLELATCFLNLITNIIFAFFIKNILIVTQN